MNSPSPAKVLSALITIQVLFGLNYVTSKVVVDAFPPLLWAHIRLMIAALILLGYCLLTRRPHPEFRWSFFGPLFIFSFLGIIFNQACFLLGLHYTISTNAAVLGTLIPVFTLMIVTVRGQEPVTVRRVLGFFSALAGVLVLRKVENFSLSDRTVIGDLLIVLNCFSFALFLSFGKSFLEKHDRVWTTTWLFLYGSVGMTLPAFSDWSAGVWPTINQELFLCAAFGVLGGTLATYFLNNFALAHSRSSNVALFIYIQPVVTSVVAWAWLGEIVTVRTVFSASLIFLGMFLAISRNQRKAI